MKKSDKIMVFGIGIILVGIIGILQTIESGSGPFYIFIAGYIPLISMFVGPIILLVGLLKND